MSNGTKGKRGKKLFEEIESKIRFLRLDLLQDELNSVLCMMHWAYIYSGCSFFMLLRRANAIKMPDHHKYG